MSGLYGPPPAILRAYRPGNGVLGFGDSITAGNTTWFADETQLYIGDRDWLAYACLLSAGRMRYRGNAGVTGNTTAQMLARLASDVLPRQPAYCTVLGGINDIAALTPLATIWANLKAIYATLIAAGIRPIPCTLCPWSSGTATAAGRQKLGQLNQLIAAYAAANGLHCLDFFAQLVDETTGFYKATLDNGDGLHPSPAGAKIMGTYVNSTLSSLFPYAPALLAGQPDDYTGTGPSILPGGLFLTNTSGVGAGWSSNGTGTFTCATDATNLPGGSQWQSLAATAGNTPQVFQFISNTKWAIGDRLRLTAKVNAVVEAGGSTWNCYLGDSGGARGASYNAASKDVTNGVVCLDFVPFAGITTSLLASFKCTGGSGAATLKVAQVRVVNLTAQGSIDY